VALVDDLEVEMGEVIHSYKSSTVTAFKRPVQEAILQLNQQAVLDGCERKENNFRYVISQIGENWVIVLLVFLSHEEEPKEYVDTIPVR
jgi:hypothetical protein